MNRLGGPARGTRRGGRGDGGEVLWRQVDVLPRLPAAIADFVLAPEEIPEHIEVYARHLRRLEEKQGFDEVLAAASASLARIADILRNKTGNDFYGYKQNTFLRRVQRRMQVLEMQTPQAYVDRLSKDAEEVTALFRDLLINVTSFFRDAQAFETLSDVVLPKLFEARGVGERADGAAEP